MINATLLQYPVLKVSQWKNKDTGMVYTSVGVTQYINDRVHAKTSIRKASAVKFLEKEFRDINTEDYHKINKAIEVLSK